MSTRNTARPPRSRSRIRIEERCILCGLETWVPSSAVDGIVVDGEHTWHRGCWLLRNSVVGWILARGVR